MVFHVGDIVVGENWHSTKISDIGWFEWDTQMDRHYYRKARIYDVVYEEMICKYDDVAVF